MSRVLILGASGMLGHKLCHLMPGYGHQVFGTVRKNAESLARYTEVFGRCKLVGGVDVLNDVALERAVSDTKPDFIINCVGLVKQHAAADDRLLAIAINAYLPHKLAVLAREKKARLIHISTDCVFDGSRGRYTEADLSDARDVYGKSKYLGETTADEPAALTLRTSFIGRELQHPAHGLIEWFLAQDGKSIKGFSNAIYSGFTSLELGKIIALVIERTPELSGLYQAASTAIDKFELLQLVKRIYGCGVTIVRDDAFQCDRSMLNERFRQATGYTAPSWSQMIEEMRKDAAPYDRWFAETHA